MAHFRLEDLPPRYRAQVEALASGLPHPLPKPDAREVPLGKVENEEGGPKRIKVRIERRGAKLLDVDNLYGSVKYVCDALRYEKLIPEDDPASIELIVTQRKVPRAERGTLIEIESLQLGNTP